MNTTSFLPSLELKAMNLKDFNSYNFNLYKKSKDKDDDAQTLTWDFDKLKSYYEIYLNIRVRQKSETKAIRYKFRQCKNTDFEKRGFVVSDQLKKSIERRLCPDQESINSDFYKVLNGYTNETERNSFSISIYKCSTSFGNYCQSNARIEQFSKQVFFTFYTLTSRADLEWKGSDNLSPIVVKDIFHSQF